MNTQKEKDYYPIVKDLVEQVLKEKFTDYYLEITANKKFSNKLKEQINPNRDIIFHFLKEAAPDLTGFVKGKYSSELMIVEVKNESIKLDDIYQARKYAELFDARYAFLVSTAEIPEEIKRLSKVIYTLLSLPVYKTLTIVRLDKETKKFIEWFPKNPITQTD